MREIVFATNNAHKLQEVRQMLGSNFRIRSLADIGCREEIPETGSTFRENAGIKSRYIYERYGLDCFSDDSGLEVNALNGEPGIYSARYAGEHGNSDANIEKLLDGLKDKSDRRAHFTAVISMILEGQESFFTGEVHGKIRHEKSGAKGFGYDPVFEPEGYDMTFAEMAPEEKNRISHRGRAVKQLVDFLKVY